MEKSFENPELEYLNGRIKELEQKVANLEALRGAGLEGIKQVLECSSREEVNAKLKEGWILLDAKGIQLKPESVKDFTGFYILGRKDAIK